MRWVGTVAKAAVGFPHLSRKKGEGAPLLSVLHLCFAVSLKLTEDVLASEVCVSRWRFYIYIYIRDIYIYIWFFGEVMTGASALVNKKCDACCWFLV